MAARGSRTIPDARFGRPEAAFRVDASVQSFDVGTVLILNTLDISTRTTAIACAVYFWSRLAHAIVYAMGLPVFRTLVFFVSFLAQVVLVLAICRVV